MEKAALGRIALVCAALLLDSAAADTAQRVVPPRVVVDGLEKAVIIDRGDRWSRLVADDAARRTRTDIGYRRSRLDASPGISTSGFSFERHTSSTPVSGSRARDLARASMAQAVVDVHASVERRRTERFERTVERQVENADGEKEWIEVTVPCLRRGVETRTSADVLRADGTKAGGWVFTRSRSAWDCDIPWRGDSTASVPSHDELARRAFRGASLEVARTFLPHWATFEPTVVRDRVVRPILRRADGRPDRAVGPLLRAHDRDPYNARILHSLGLALELDGRPGDAAAVFRLAARIDDREVHGEAARRAAAAARQAEVLSRAYGLKTRPPVRAGLDRVVARARQAQAVELGPERQLLRGTRNRRTPIFGRPARDGAVLATLPGRVAVSPLYATDGFVKVELPDGIRGYVPDRRLR